MIRDEHGRIVPMKFSDSQNIMWRYVAPQLDNNERLWFIVLKSRQAYITTFFENLTFVRTIERPNTNSLVIAQDLDSAGSIFGMAKRFYDHLPLPKLKPSKTKEILFPLPGGTSAFRVVSAGSMAKGRGTTQSCIHCSEVAFWQHSEVMTGLFQTIPDLPDTLWVLESTANGMIGQGAMFYEQWKMAVKGESNLIPIFIPWFVMPKYRNAIAIPEGDWDDEERVLVEEFGQYGLDGHSLGWRRETISTKCRGLLEVFHQEYPSSPTEAFISSGMPAFDPLSVLKQQRNICPPMARGTMRDGKFVRMPKGEISVWREPQDGHNYFIGVDTSEGIKDASGRGAGDYSCAQIVDMTDLEQVGMIHGWIPPWDMARICSEVGRWYKTAMVNVEVKSTGHAVQDYMIRIFRYPRLHPWRGKPANIHHREPKKWGWDTNVASRPLLIEAGRRCINRNLLTIHDAATLEEIQHFSRQDDGGYEASSGHDDRVMALLLALRSGEENYTDIRPAYWTDGSLSEPDLRGVRVLDASEPDKMGRKRIHMLLNKANKAVKTWMEI